MKKNLGTADRLARVILAVVVGVLFLTNQISGTTAIVLGLFAVVFLVTSFMSFCPLYAMFNLSTKKEAA
jgi:hypothetical protein